MQQIAETKTEELVPADMVEMCESLFNEWLADLSVDEKKI